MVVIILTLFCSVNAQRWIRRILCWSSSWRMLLANEISCYCFWTATSSLPYTVSILLLNMLSWTALLFVMKWTNSYFARRQEPLFRTAICPWWRPIYPSSLASAFIQQIGRAFRAAGSFLSGECDRNPRIPSWTRSCSQRFKARKSGPFPIFTSNSYWPLQSSRSNLIQLF